MIRFCWELRLTNLISWYKTEGLALLTLLVVLTASEECKKINPCRCQFQNGSVIDITSLGAHGQARFEFVPSQDPKDENTYHYNPCFDFKLPENAEVTATSQCANGVAACQVFTNKTYKTYTSLGTQQSATFHWNEQLQRVYVLYSISTHERIANVSLICNADHLAADTFKVEERHMAGRSETIEMSLLSRCACPDVCGRRGLSAGSVLLILFSVFVILYLMFGIIFNKLTRGAQGWELIPNYEFWQDFPLLVRDGCVYVASGCKPDTTYERI